MKTSIVRVDNQRQRKNFGNKQGAVGNVHYKESYNFKNDGCLLIRNDGGQKAMKLYKVLKEKKTIN